MENRKDKIKTAVAATIVILLIFTAIMFVLKYNVEGENNMPFKLERIVIGSTVVSEDTEHSQINMQNNIVQNNGIYIEVKKDEKYSNEAVIKNIEISNIEIIRKPLKGEVKVYIPNTKENEKFTYSNEYILDGDKLTYKGAGKSDTTVLEVNNQGGIVAIAFGNTNLGTYSLTTEALKIDGTMLKNMGITNEEIEFEVKFELVINTESNKYATTVKLTLPSEEIITTGKSSKEITDLKQYVFKRVTK